MNECDDMVSKTREVTLSSTVETSKCKEPKTNAEKEEDYEEENILRERAAMK
jgi:hypothetical protein